MALDMYLRSSSIEIKTPKEIEAMRTVGRLAADTLTRVGAMIRPGITTESINDFVHQDTLAKGARPAPLNYRGGGSVPFPKSVCTSVNEVVCHGIPGTYVLKEGDIVNVDVTHIFQGFHGDTSATFYVGRKLSPEAKLVTEVARRCLDLGIEQVRPGGRIGDIGAAITEFAHAQGCAVVRDFVGHGIGRKFHDEPKVAHYGQWGKGARLKPGMTFTIEPMINVGSWEIEVLDDDWTAVTADGTLSAQFEHTVLVTETGVEVLTARSSALESSEIFPDFFETRS
ncbi:MAG TPA: type I methionyl aminopeptidase [Polyangiaceae bacterium]|nr:type I methionyl aminopeptidase [Polyangiaceae bacterium]